MKSLLKLLLNLLGYGICTLVSSFVKVDSSLFLFTSGISNSYNGNAKYLFEKMLNDKKFICYWVTKKKNMYKYLKSLGKNTIYLYSFKAIVLIFKAKYFIGTVNNVVPIGLLTKEKIVIQTWHGTPLKTVGVFKKRRKLEDYINTFYVRRYNYFISPANYVSNLFSKCFQNKIDKSIETGNPRNDILFAKLDKIKILKQLGMKENTRCSKILLYCPTFRENNKTVFFPFKDFDSDKLNNFLEQNNIICIIRNHSHDSKDGLKESKRNERLLSAPPDNINIDVQELLNISDILITDYSSIYFDFLLLDRPIIFIPYDIKEYGKTRGFLLDYYHNTPGPKVFTFKDFVEAIKAAIKETKLYKKQRRKINKVFNHYMDNKSTERVVNFIEEIQRIDHLE